MTDRRGLITLALIACAGAAACGHPESRVIDQYFSALNAKDSQTLSSFAAVSLDTQGKRVEKWRISQVGLEQRGPAPVVALVQKLKDAEAAVAANKKAYTSYFLDHPTEVDQVRELMKKGQPFPPRLQLYGAKWKDFTEKEKDLKRAVAEAKDELEHEKRNVSLSLGITEGIESMGGEMIAKTVDLALTIGGVAQDHVMTLRKYEMTGEKAPRVNSRWMVYELKPKG